MKKQFYILAAIPVICLIVILFGALSNFLTAPMNEAVVKVHLKELDSKHKKGDSYSYDGVRYVHAGAKYVRKDDSLVNRYDAALIVPTTGKNNFLIIRGFKREE